MISEAVVPRKNLLDCVSETLMKDAANPYQPVQIFVGAFKITDLAATARYKDGQSLYSMCERRSRFMFTAAANKALGLVKEARTLSARAGHITRKINKLIYGKFKV